MGQLCGDGEDAASYSGLECGGGGADAVQIDTWTITIGFCNV